MLAREVTLLSFPWLLKNIPKAEMVFMARQAAIIFYPVLALMLRKNSTHSGLMSASAAGKSKSD